MVQKNAKGEGRSYTWQHDTHTLPAPVLCLAFLYAVFYTRRDREGERARDGETDGREEGKRERRRDGET